MTKPPPISEEYRLIRPAFAPLFAAKFGDIPRNEAARRLRITEKTLRKMLQTNEDVVFYGATMREIALELGVSVDRISERYVNNALAAGDRQFVSLAKAVQSEYKADVVRALGDIATLLDRFFFFRWIRPGGYGLTREYPFLTEIRVDVPPGGAYATFRVPIKSDEPLDGILGYPYSFAGFMFVWDFGLIHAEGGTGWCVEPMSRRVSEKRLQSPTYEFATWVGRPEDTFVLRTTCPITVMEGDMMSTPECEARLRDADDPLVGLIANGVHAAIPRPWLDAPNREEYTRSTS